jgi:hypothetical protein
MDTPVASTEDFLGPRLAPYRRRLVIAAIVLGVIATGVYGYRITRFTGGVDLTAYLSPTATIEQEGVIVTYLRTLDIDGDVDARAGGAEAPTGTVATTLKVRLGRPETLGPVEAHLASLPGVARVASPA